MSLNVARYIRNLYCTFILEGKTSIYLFGLSLYLHDLMGYTKRILFIEYEHMLNNFPINTIKLSRGARKWI